MPPSTATMMLRLLLRCAHRSRTLLATNAPHSSNGSDERQRNEGRKEGGKKGSKCAGGRGSGQDGGQWKENIMGSGQERRRADGHSRNSLSKHGDF
jgi:hypothetical protein